MKEDKMVGEPITRFEGWTYYAVKTEDDVEDAELTKALHELLIENPHLAYISDETKETYQKIIDMDGPL